MTTRGRWSGALLLCGVVLGCGGGDSPGGQLPAGTRLYVANFGENAVLPVTLDAG
jgi:hypothetical protein